MTSQSQGFYEEDCENVLEEKVSKNGRYGVTSFMDCPLFYIGKDIQVENFKVVWKLVIQVESVKNEEGYLGRKFRAFYGRLGYASNVIFSSKNNFPSCRP